MTYSTLLYDVFKPVHPSSSGPISLHTALQTCLWHLGIFQECLLDESRRVRGAGREGRTTTSWSMHVCTPKEWADLVAR